MDGKLAMTCASPLLLISLGFVTAAVLRCIKHLRKQRLHFTLLEELCQVIGVCVIISHATCTHTAMLFFATVDIDGEKHLRANISLPFDSEQHQASRGIAVMLLVYISAVPLIFVFGMVYLHLYHPHLLDLTCDQDHFVFKSFANLYAKQKPFAKSPVAPLWVAVTLCRKIGLNAVVVFVERGATQSALALALLVVSTALLAYTKPYRRDNRDMQIMNRVELYSLLTISMTICLALFKSSSQEGEVDDDDCASASGVDVLMVAINAAIIGYMTLLLVCGGATGLTTFRKSMLRRISRTPTRTLDEDDLHEIEITASVADRLQRNSSLNSGSLEIELQELGPGARVLDLDLPEAPASFADIASPAAFLSHLDSLVDEAHAEQQTDDRPKGKHSLSMHSLDLR